MILLKNNTLQIFERIISYTTLVFMGEWGGNFMTNVFNMCGCNMFFNKYITNFWNIIWEWLIVEISAAARAILRRIAKTVVEI